MCILLKKIERDVNLRTTICNEHARNRHTHTTGFFGL